MISLLRLFLLLAVVPCSARRQPIAKARCLLRMFFLDFDLVGFDKYDRYFNDDSIMEYAAAGSYQGSDAIEEYVRFATSSSPFLLAAPNELGKLKTNFVGYDWRTGNCEFLVSRIDRYAFDPSYTPYEADFYAASVIKLSYNMRKFYISRINVFLPNGFIDLVFNVLHNSDNSRAFVCSVITGPCKSIVGFNGTAESCEETLAALPMVDEIEEALYFDGDSQGCRTLHAVFANTNPENHCAHISFEPMADPKGAFKCRESVGISSSDLFTEDDFRIFNDFCTANGIDPEVGHDEVVPDEFVPNRI
jgi:hypothetical protein